MASSAKYTPVTGERGDSSSSNGARDLTPDSDTEDHGEELDDLEAGEGYEMEELRNKSGRREKEVHAGADDEESDDEYESRPPMPKSSRRTSIQSFELYTPDEEAAVRRKLDRRLVLFLALLYLLSFLDRSNIGNARVAGLEHDLALQAGQFDWLLSAFYIAYIVFEWMTILYKVLPAHIYISLCVAAWSLIAGLQSVATNFAFLLVLRTLLGVAEAAFGPGVPFYLSFFFRRDELAFRTGLFISAAPLATSFASSLAWGIVSIGEKTGISSWRLLFLVEGFPTVLIAVWAWWWIPDSPGTARWLSSREKRVATLRLRKPSGGGRMSEKGGRQGQRKPSFQWAEVGKTLADPKSYLTAGMFFSCNVAFSSMPVFLPTIINDMGYSAQSSQALSAPVFLFAFLVVLLTAYLSDRYKTRSIPIMVHAVLAMLGYLLLSIAGPLKLGNTSRYISTFPICAGFFSAVTIVISWTVNNQDSDEGKGTGVALLNTIGQLGPLVGTRLYPKEDAPYYTKGMATCAAFMAMVGILAFVLRLVLSRANVKQRRRDGGTAAMPLVGDGGRRAEAFMFML